MKSVVLAALVLVALGGTAHAAATLATPPLRVDDDEFAACIPMNVGNRDVTVRLEIYRGGSRLIETGARVLVPNQVGAGLSVLEVARGGAAYSCRFHIEKGSKKSVRAVVERRVGAGTQAALEAR